TVVSFMAVQWTNVPMYLVLRRANTLFALVGEALILHKSIRLASVEAVVVILVGTALAGYGDLTYDFFGYVAAFSQNFFTTASNVCTYRLTHESAQTCQVEVALFIHTLFSIPLLLGLAMWTGELTASSIPLDGTAPVLMFTILVYVLLVALHQISNTMSIVNGGPVSTSVAGNCKDI
ncbi:UDP-glucuronic acid/UDP-N-acetylgalactosamine transporter, putative, partial [Perkinsus marinus ATCC 50983]